MKTIEISYNPYKMITKMLIDGIDVCQNECYDKFREFIENKVPLQTWIEPIHYLDWQGLVNEVSDSEYNDEVKVIFSGRKIDFYDLKRSIKDQNEKRSAGTRVIYHYQHKKVLDDMVLSKNIEDVVAELKSDRFRELVAQRTTEGLTKKYEKLDENYTIAKETVFYIVLAGVYSSGKSTLLNTLIRHDVLPYSGETCTSKNCRIRHDSSLGTKISLAGYGVKNEESGTEPVVIEKRIYDSDEECAAAFLEICPIKGENTEGGYPDVETMEIGVDLSHLYPDSVNKDNFTIVLIDTPGVDSAQSSEDGTNKHAEIALEAISMESKPMIFLCVDANKYEDKSIGEFMREIIAQAQEEGSGFNDRFLFLMNKSDLIAYKQNETPEGKRSSFAKYLTDYTKWGIKGNEEELQQLAEDASHFVPRVFMTAAAPAFAIASNLTDIPKEEIDNNHYYFRRAYDGFNEMVMGRRFPEKYFLSRYCDIPNYRKDEIEKEFNSAISNENDVRATELQCGVVSVELAIKDYIERYAYPIKVRGLLETFEDILEDVNGFTKGVLSDLNQAKKELGEKSSEREGVKKEKKGVEEKSAALEKVKEKIDEQLKALDSINFDSQKLKQVVSDYRADIEADENIIFIRRNPNVATGQKPRYTVEQEIDKRISDIKRVFDSALEMTNEKLKEIKQAHDGQIRKINGLLGAVVADLEKSGVFEKDEFNFKDSIIGQKLFENINSEKFADDLKKTAVSATSGYKSVTNYKKIDWRYSRNPFKKFASWFMAEEKKEKFYVDGYYETTSIRQSIDRYLLDLTKQSGTIECDVKADLKKRKEKVRDLIGEVIRNLEQFHEDIKMQEQRINKLGDSIDKLDEEIKIYEDTKVWLDGLRDMIKGDA